MEKYKTRQEIAIEMGISYSSLRRKIKEKYNNLPKGLLSPRDQNAIKALLGCKIQQEENLIKEQ